jgi:hypothetical protein
MIRFRQKEFVLPLLAAGSGMGLMAVGTGISAVQGKKANRIAQEQGEQAAAEQARANREMERIAKQQAADQKRALKQMARQQNPTIVPMMDTMNTINNQPPVSSPLDYRQNSYSNTSVLSNLSQKSFAKVNLKNLGQTSYDVIKSLRGTKSKVIKNTSGANSGIFTGDWIRGGLAMGAGMTGMSYLVDKGIQLDRKRSGMPELEQKEVTEKEKRKKTRGLITTGLGAAGLVAGGVAAKRGALGSSWQNWANKNLTKQSLLNRAKAEPRKMGKALKENAFNKGSLLFGGALALPPIMQHISEKKAYKEQIKDQQENQRTYSEDDKENKRGGLLKKAAIGTALAAGTIAAGRRGYLGAGMQKGTGNLIARTGKVFKSQRLQDIGAKSWGEGAAKTRAKNKAAREFKNANNGNGPAWYEFGKKSDIRSRAKEIQNADNKYAATYENVYKNNILSKESKATYAVKHPLRTVLSGADRVTRFDIGGKESGERSANQIVNNLRKQGQASGNEGTQKLADFLGNHKTLAVAGSLGVGSLLFKPFTWGDKIVREGTKLVDKNSFAYENRNQEEVQ